ncbi:MAG: hypothetical protein ACK5N8_02920 [Alphaproteobacteria bacterium]
MNCKNNNHFSNNFELNISKLPTKRTDRASFSLFLPNLFFAVLLIAIGVYELFNGFNSSASVFDDVNREIEYTSLMVSPVIFDLVLITVGFWIVWSLYSSFVRYKKVFFDGHVFTITHRPTWGAKKVFRESAANYEGVRFRTAYYQHGLFNRNKYIIELYHEDECKTVPLFITTKDIRFGDVISKYAKYFNKSIIYVTSEGVIHRKLEDFGKPLMGNKKKAYAELSENVSEPRYIRVKDVDDKIIIKVKKALFDVYNIIAFGILFSLGSLVFFLSTLDYERTQQTDALFVFSIVGIFLCFFALFRRDKIVIKKDKIIVVHKFWLFSKKYDEMKKSDIVWISIAYNPALERNYLIIYSMKESMVFGKKLPLNDLKWVKNLLIEEIVK